MCFSPFKLRFMCLTWVGAVILHGVSNLHLAWSSHRSMLPVLLRHRQRQPRQWMHPLLRFDGLFLRLKGNFRPSVPTCQTALREWNVSYYKRDRQTCINQCAIRSCSHRNRKPLAHWNTYWCQLLHVNYIWVITTWYLRVPQEVF